MIPSLVGLIWVRKGPNRLSSSTLTTLGSETPIGGLRLHLGMEVLVEELGAVSVVVELQVVLEALVMDLGCQAMSPGVGSMGPGAALPHLGWKCHIL